MIVERIVSTWVQLNYLDMRMTITNNLTTSAVNFLAKQQAQAQKQHLAALQAWRQWQHSLANRPAPWTGAVQKPHSQAGNNAAAKPVILPFSRRAESA